MTVTTPGKARARDVSMRAMRACGSFARRIPPCSIRGSSRSWRKRVRPVTFSAPSLFGVARPMTLRSVTRRHASRERAYPQPLVQQAGPLVERGGAPHLEERRPEHLHEPGVVEHGTNAVLAVDGRELRVAIERREVLRVEDDDRDGEERLAVPLVQELSHQVGIGRVRLRARAAAAGLAVPREDAEVEPRRVGQARDHGDVAAAVRRPLLRDRQHLGGPAGLGHEPLPCRLVSGRQPCRVVRRAQILAVVPAWAPRALASQVLRRGHELPVLLERHSLREPRRVHHFTGSLCSPKTFFMAWAISPSVAYALTASMMAGMRLVEPRASSPSRRSVAVTALPSRSRRTRSSFVTCASATFGSKRYSSTS